MRVEEVSTLKQGSPGARGTGRVERRRARTRQRILEVAEGLVRRRGVEAVTIDEITEAADIARRSFYHHFDSKHDLLVPVARAHTRSLNRSIDRLIEDLSDPAEIVAIGLRHTLRGILDDPLCCWFILRSGLPHDRLREGIGESAARDLESGVRTGRFVIPNHAVLGDMVSGAVVGVLSAYLRGSLSEADLDDTVEYVLRLLGVPPAEARRITHRPLPSLPQDAGTVDKQLHPSIRREKNEATRGERNRVLQKDSEKPFAPSRPRFSRGRIEGLLRRRSTVDPGKERPRQSRPKPTERKKT